MENNDVDVLNLIDQMNVTISQMEDILSILKDQEYIRIGEFGDIWTGDVAESTYQTFDSLYVKFRDFSNIVNKYTENIINKRS